MYILDTHQLSNTHVRIHTYVPNYSRIWQMESLEKFRFKSPSTITFAGPTSSGKTFLCAEIIRNRNELFDKPVDRIIYCYNNSLSSHLNDPLVEYHNGIFDIKLIPSNNRNHVLLILDDLSEHITSDTAQLFSVFSHHKNISVIFICQNLFLRNKSARDISLNTMYLCLFRQKRDLRQIKCLGSQMFPGNSKAFMMVYNECTSGKYSYLMIDLHPEHSHRVILRTGILPSDLEIIYLPDGVE